MAGNALRRVRAPTLLIVGGLDDVVLGLNREAMELLPGTTERSMEVIPGATHLFEEHGALQRVSELAARWFREHLQPGEGAWPAV